MKPALILRIDPRALGRWPEQYTLSPSTHLFFSLGFIPVFYLSVCHLAPIMFFQVIAFLAADNS